MKTEGGIIKHIQYFITLKLFRVHSPVILLLAGKGNGELSSGMEQSLEKPGAGWSWLFRRRLSLVCSHIGTTPSKKPKIAATVRTFFFLSNTFVSVFFHLVFDTYCLLTTVSAQDLVHCWGENVCDSERTVERQSFHNVGSLFTLQETLNWWMSN